MKAKNLFSIRARWGLLAALTATALAAGCGGSSSDAVAEPTPVSLALSKIGGFLLPYEVRWTSATLCEVK